MTISTTERIRTTVSLPAELLNRAQVFVDRGLVRSRNALVVRALDEWLANLEREAIDSQFAMMADDADYQKFNVVLAQEFDDSDWEALQVGEAAL